MLLVRTENRRFPVESRRDVLNLAQHAVLGPLQEFDKVPPGTAEIRIFRKTRAGARTHGLIPIQLCGPGRKAASSLRNFSFSCSSSCTWVSTCFIASRTSSPV